MASAINVLDDVHGGAGQQCMELYRAIDVQAGPDGDLEAAAKDIIERRAKAGDKIVPGFGHRFHPIDPRCEPLFALVAKAEAAGEVTGRWAAIGRAVEAALKTIKGRRIPMNIDGITAVIFCELGFEPSLAAGCSPCRVRSESWRTRGNRSSAAAASWGRCRGKFHFATADRRSACCPTGTDRRRKQGGNSNGTHDR